MHAHSHLTEWKNVELKYSNRTCLVYDKFVPLKCQSKRWNQPGKGAQESDTFC